MLAAYDLIQAPLIQTSFSGGQLHYLPPRSPLEPLYDPVHSAQARSHVGKLSRALSVVLELISTLAVGPLEFSLGIKCAPAIQLSCAAPIHCTTAAVRVKMKRSHHPPRRCPILTRTMALHCTQHNHPAATVLLGHNPGSQISVSTQGHQPYRTDVW